MKAVPASFVSTTRRMRETALQVRIDAAVSQHWRQSKSVVIKTLADR
jgi:acyl carrier protein phosphodiesterase